MSSSIVVNKITSTDSNRWNDLLFNSINASYRQTIPYEYAQELNGRKVSTFVFQKNGTDVAGAHYSIKKIFRNLITIADVLSGFVFKAEPDPELLAFLFEHFVKWAKEKKATYIRINPWLPKSIAGTENDVSSVFSNVISGFGFKVLEPGRHTYWVNLDKEEELLHSSLSKKARQNIRRAKNRGMELVMYQSPNDNILEEFWELYVSRSHQKSIPVISKTFMFDQVSKMMESGEAKLYFAKYEGQMINVSLVSTFGQAASLHSGMNPEVNSNKNIPSPGHFLRWEIIRDLKKTGNKIHDMGFCPGPVPVKGHSNYGIWYFKYSFAGDHVEFLPTYGKAIKPLSGRLTQYLKYKK